MQDEAYYKQQFFTESRDLLDSVSDELIKLEATPAGESLHAVFRHIHTIKGSAGVFELNELSGFAHHIENVLNKACTGSIQVTPDLVDMLFQAVDALNAILDACQAGEKPKLYQDLADRFQAFAAEEEAHAATVVPVEKTLPLAGQIMPDGLRASLRARAAQGYTPYLVELHFTSDMLENGYDPLVLLRNLKEASVVWSPSTRVLLPDLENYEPLQLYLEIRLFLASLQSARELRDYSFDEDLLEVTELSVDDENGDSIDAQCLKDFLESDSLLVEQMEDSALRFEKTRDPDALNGLFRAVHTFKGDASYVGLKRLGTFAHDLEALLDSVRKNPELATSAVVDTVLGSVDTIKQGLVRLARGEVDPVLGDVAAPAEQEAPKSSGDALSMEVSKVFLVQLGQHKKVLEDLCSVDLPETPEKCQLVHRMAQGMISAADFVGLRELRQLVETLIEGLDKADGQAYGVAYTALLGWMDEITGESWKLGEILCKSGQVSPQDIKGALKLQKPLGEILVEEGKLDRETLEAALKKQTIMRAALQQEEPAEAAPVGGTAEIRVMRVDEEKIDTLSNMIGELMVAKNVYDYLITRLLVDHDLPPSVTKNFKDNLYLFSRITSGLQQGLLSVRMIPIRGVFQKYSRVIRDIARKQKKLIDFVTEGEDTEIDKKVADILSEPLIHMVRNACDHGIETPEERRAAGKREKGTVRLRAWQEGSRLYVRVTDDGKGMNRQRVFDKALERGLSVTSPDDERLLDVIFLPGFSMKDQVTDISGRGVGMDAVRASVTSLGGSVSFTSIEGKGSVFTLELPMTMGISSALVVLAAGKQYAIPLDSVLETIKVPPSRIRTFHTHKGMYYRGETLPVEQLDTLLYQRKHSGDPRELFHNREYSMFSLYDNAEEVAVVVLNTPRGKFGVVVDGLTRNVEIAIRPVPEALKDIAVISGVSILGDGRVLLVLNPEYLL